MVDYSKSNEMQKKMILRAIFGEDAFNEEYEDAIEYVYSMFESDIMNEYLVSGALLKCEKSTAGQRYIDGECYWARTKGMSQLAVDHKEYINGLPCANLSDARKNINIIPFGNCMDKLTEAEEQYLRSIPNAKTEGICKYLMRLSNHWDIFPSDKEMEIYEGYPTINMQSRLFCGRGAFIFPVTSGQRIVKHGYEDTPWVAIDISEAKFACEVSLSKERMRCFTKIQKYFNDYPELLVGNVIFAFEGLGSYDGPKDYTGHSNGQFGAMFVYYRDGEPVCLSINCSTLPDYNRSATIMDGVYDAVYHMHGGENYEYQALQLHTSASNFGIDAVYHYEEGDKYIAKKSRATGINMHAAGHFSARSIWSEGCLTILSEDYKEFAKTAGFVEDRPGDYKTYAQIKLLNNINLHMETHWGYVVVNRDYMDKEVWNTFLKYEEDKKEENEGNP